MAAVETPLDSDLEEIARHAEHNPDWLERSGLCMKQPRAREPRAARAAFRGDSRRATKKAASASTVEHLYVELRLHSVPHEIVVVDDGSTDSTWAVLQKLHERIPAACARCRTPARTVSAAPSACGIDHSAATPWW